jgi:hypothetical protein
VVSVEADPVHVELLGAINIGHRYRDELDLPVHAQQPTRGSDSSAGPRRSLGSARPARPSSSAAVGALESEPKDSAQPAGDVVHDGGRQLASGCLQVGLIEGDQGGDVDD